MSDEFFTDITTLCERARQHIERGALPKGLLATLDPKAPAQVGEATLAPRGMGSC